MSLATRYRPRTLDDVAGQEKPKRIVRRMLETDALTSMIFFGGPGEGKTTIANIIADESDMPLVRLNATLDTPKTMRSKLDELDAPKVLVYIDEIQYWNRKQQQTLLSPIESGEVVLIAATTESPWHGLYDALISRCSVIEFERVSPGDVYCRVAQVIASEHLNMRVDKTALELVSHVCAGDVRRALNMLDMALDATDDDDVITDQTIRDLMPSMNMGSFDTDGDAHYSLVSALQKSIRGSDPDAAVFYLMRFLAAGDLVSPCRRLPAICCEDIGLADPDAIVHTMACIEAAERLGLPEAAKPLAQAVIYLATAPKSASNEAAWMPALDDIKAGRGATIPAHIASEHAPGYVWPQDQPRHWTPQQYLPDDLIDRRYYKPQDDDFEYGRAWWWDHVRSGDTRSLPSNQPRM